jgi:hypothetical protein
MSRGAHTHPTSPTRQRLHISKHRSIRGLIALNNASPELQHEPIARSLLHAPSFRSTGGAGQRYHMLVNQCANDILAISSLAGRFSCPMPRPAAERGGF